MALKCAPNVGNYPAYSYSNLPGVLYSPKGFKCMFAATKHQANDLPEAGMTEKEQRE